MPESRTEAPDTRNLLACYESMLRIRYFEETLSDLFTRNLVGGTSHFCIGQEACAVGVISETRPDDFIISNHRGHGHLLARGLAPARVLAELMGRETGYCGGRGGSQHMCSMADHFLGTNGITGGGIPIATGAAYALKYKGSDQIAVVFFGDGASNQGTFHESLNMASLWQLPVLYVCENNAYAMSMPAVASIAGGSIAARGAAYAMRTETADGMDLVAVKQRSAALTDFVRNGNGPALLELSTYRFCGHSKNDERVYRTRAEEAERQGGDCLGVAAAILSARGVSETELAAAGARARSAIDAALDEASQAPYGTRAHALGGVYAEP